MKKINEKINFSTNDMEHNSIDGIDYNLYSTMITAPKLLNYYIERSKFFIYDSKKHNKFILDCYSLYQKDNKNFNAIKIASKFLEATYIMEYDDINTAKKIIDDLFNSLSIEDELFIDNAKLLIKEIIDISFLEKLTLEINTKNTFNEYKKILKK